MLIERSGVIEMIVTVSLNPAVDKTCRLKEMEPGAVNRLYAAESVAGGKAVNVSKVLRQFHIPVSAVGFLGGSGGSLIGEAMEELGVECHFTKIAGETRTNTNVLDEDGRVTELLEPGPVISEKELTSFLKQFTGCLENCKIAVLSGSLPEGVPADIYASLVRLCHMAGCKVLLDSSGEALRLGIQAVPDIIKPNRKELEFLAGRPLQSREELIEAAGALLELGIEKIVISLGSEGLLGIEGEGVSFQEAKHVQVVNTVGCGDTVVASLCMSELSGEDMETALAKAAALAAANATTRENGSIPMETYLELL